MIVWIMTSLPITLILYVGLSFLKIPVMIRSIISVVLFLILVGVGVFFMSRIDDPPEGSRVITQEELMKSAGIGDNTQPGRSEVTETGTANLSQN
jgi:hypothetical protein